MAPFDGRYSPDLINKVSTQIDGQLPDFVADDHPIFSTFLQSYYKYLESGELVVSATIDNVLLELETTTRLLDENDNRIVLETGTGTTGKFIVGETITGASSLSSATVTKYRANPVQNIQQLLEYANVDNTIYDFLDKFKDSFLECIPNTLASG